MGAHTRHIRALTKKNFINWRRTWFGSFIELIFPVLLMVGVCLFKKLGNTRPQEEESYLNLAHAQYPLLELAGINWVFPQKKPVNLLRFLNFANLTNIDDNGVNATLPLNKTSNATLDNEAKKFQWDPQTWLPQHCYSYMTMNQTIDGDDTNYTVRSGNRNQTAIGYIKHDNQIEKEFIKQLRLTIDKSASMMPGWFHNYTLVPFINKEHLELYLRDPKYNYDDENPGLCFAFEINKFSDQRYEVKLMFNDQIQEDPYGAGIPRQSQASYNPIANSADLVSFYKYQRGGFALMENWIANTVLRASVDPQNATIAMITVPMKSAAYNTDPLMEYVLVYYLPAAIALMFILPVFRLTYRLVQEKETRVRESMQMMGLSEFAYWVSWFLYYIVINTYIASVSTGILCGWLLNYTQWQKVFQFIWLYGLSLFGQVIFCQAFFQTAKFAGIFSMLFYITSYFVYYLVRFDGTPKTLKMLVSLLPASSASLIVGPLGAFESVGIGLNSENSSETYQNYVFNEGLLMLVLDFVLFTLVGIYLDNIMPREHGLRKSPMYPCNWLTPTYWDCFDICKRHRRQLHVHNEDEDDIDDPNHKTKFDQRHDKYNFETKYIRKENFEMPDEASLDLEKRHKFLKIQHLRKTFDNGFRAVDGLNVRMYEGQIFALLGHNGAGKTTTISMLTGVIRATKGQASVFGYNMFHRDIDEVRRLMGVCPQHDILFDLLTPEEHLSIFQDFKGVEKDKAKKRAEIEKLLKDVGLWDSRNVSAKRLSGGQRRKLSVAIALCGYSKFVMLDEPTAGMDLQARRGLWNMLKTYRTGRIIILTTHYMDEADVLGDRIGIMANGNLVCLGSSLFLKKRYGVGYNLTMVKTEAKPNFIIGAYLKKQLDGDVRKLSEISREITYQIPVEASSQFQSFFIDFDKNLQSLGIQGYGISVTTLEEVFLRVGDGRDMGEIHQEELFLKQQAKKQKETPQDEEKLLSDNEEHEKIKRKFTRAIDAEIENYSIAEKDFSSFFKNLRALFSKRFTIYRRGYRKLIAEVFIPCLLVCCGFAATKASFYYDSPPRTLETKLYPLMQRMIANEEPVLRWPKLPANFTNITNAELPGLWEDHSVESLLDLLPSSYTLARDVDFEINYWNYTQDYLTSLNVSATLKKAQASQDELNNNFNLYRAFDDDVFSVRQSTTKLSDIDAQKVLDGTLPAQADESKPYRFGHYFVYEANATSQQYKVINWVNTTSQDSSAAFPHFMYQAILRRATGNENFQFRVISEPFPILQKYKDKEKNTSTGALIMVIAIGFSILPAMAIGNIMYEREKDLKHMQMICGMNTVAYWIVNIIFDIIKLEFIMAICVGLLFAFNLNEYYLAIPIFGLWPLGMVTLTHASSFLFTTEWAAQFFTVFFNLLVMAALPLAVLVMSLIEDTAQIAEVINFYARVFPGYSLPHTLLFCGTGKQRSLARLDFDNPLAPLDLDPIAYTNIFGTGIALCAQFVLGVLLIFFFEGIVYQSIWIRWFYSRCACCFRQHRKVGENEIATNMDIDVQVEEDRVVNSGPKDFQVKVDRFKKIYRTGIRKQTVAVERASFGLEFGECFTLLGVNGAGKTTTFKSLTNDIVPTSGKVYIGGYDIAKDFNKARKLIGYCPQHNVLFDTMTVKEHLHFYSLIKGVKNSVMKRLIQSTIEQLDLLPYTDKVAGTLSGGNKRKLQVAIAIIGNPPIILLDEPSAGMDPEARRFMWSVVAGISQKRHKSAVILTTHSMEEAEALSTKVGIMVTGGIFKCFGSVQHIKNKFGTSYEIEVKFQTLNEQEFDDMIFQFEIPRLKTRMTMQEFYEVLISKKFSPLLLNELKEGGLGDELVRESWTDSQYKVKTTRLIDWVYVMQNALNVIRKFAEVFETVEILEHYHDYFKLRVLRQDKTIGYVFGMLESMKTELKFAKYSASQTTLEQIFGMFANMGLEDNAGHMVVAHAPNELERVVLTRTSKVSGPMPGQQMRNEDEKTSLLKQVL